MPIEYALVARGKTVLAEYTATSGNFPTVTRVLLGKIKNEDAKMSYVYDKYVFHYVVNDGITFLCMADEDFKQRVPFTFLEDIQNDFLTTYGDRKRTAIAFAMNEEFQHVIHRKMDYYNANPAADKITHVQQQLNEVRGTMIDNIEKVLERGEKIELLVESSDKLNQQSFRFERKSRQLKNTMWWKNMKMWFFLIFVGLVAIYFVISMVCGFDLSSCRSSSKDP